MKQLATARPRDYDAAAATFALHDRARYTDGCAAYPVPSWAGVFLRAVACFARLVSGEDQELLAALGDRAHLLRVAETARLCPPQPPAARRLGPAGRVEWDWRERQEAKRYEAMLAAIARFGVSGWRVSGGFPWCCPDALVSELGIGLAAGVATVVR